MASQIGKKTADTAEKLKELMELAKSKNPFGDPSDRIELLTRNVSQEISLIKEDIDKLQRLVSSGATGRNKQLSDHSVSIIHTLHSNLLTTTKDFNDALQIRTKSLKSQQERREKWQSRRPGGIAPVYRPVAFEMVDDDDHEGEDEVRIVLPSLQTEDDFLVQRSNQIQNIEGHVNEIKTIFETLSGLVAIQGEKIRRIEDNVDETMIHAEGAVEQLMKYLKGLSNNQWLIVKVFLVLVFFMLVFILFFA